MSNVAKIFEKILHNRIYNFVTKYKIISDKQYGFIEKLGTKDALQQIINIRYQNLDENISFSKSLIPMHFQYTQQIWYPSQE